MREAYKAFIQIDGKWERIAWSYTHAEFKQRLSDIKKLYPNHEIRTNECFT